MQENNVRRLAQMQFQVADRDRSGTVNFDEFLIIYAFIKAEANKGGAKPAGKPVAGKPAPGRAKPQPPSPGNGGPPPPGAGRATGVHNKILIRLLLLLFIHRMLVTWQATSWCKAQAYAKGTTWCGS